MRLAIRKHLRDFLAVIGLIVLGLVVGVYILASRACASRWSRTRPSTSPSSSRTPRPSQPGQGQTVRVAGVEVGRISGVEVEDGVAVVDVELEHEYEDLIREDATALLRPKTALKDMFLEVSPGTGRVLDEGDRIDVANTLPDVDPDEIYAALDADTRPYLKLLVSGAGEGLRGRGTDLREMFRRFEPVHRDLARVTRATARRRVALKRLVHRYGLLMQELGAQPRRPAQAGQLLARGVRLARRRAAEHLHVGRATARVAAGLRARARRGAALRAAAAQHARVAARADPQAARDQRGAHALLYGHHAGPARRDPPVRARGGALHRRPAAGRPRPEQGNARPGHRARGDQPLLQHGSPQPGWRREPRRAVGGAAAQPPGGPPLLAGVGGAERRLAVLHRRRPGAVAPRHDLQGPRGGPERADRRRPR